MALKNTAVTPVENAPRTSVETEKHPSWSSDIHPAARCPPHSDRFQQDLRPTDSPLQPAQKSGAWERRRRVGRRPERPPSTARQSLRALAMQSSAPAPRTPSPWDNALGADDASNNQGPHLSDARPGPGIRGPGKPPTAVPGSGNKLPPITRGCHLTCDLSLIRYDKS